MFDMGDSNRVKKGGGKRGKGDATLISSAQKVSIKRPLIVVN